MEKMQRPLRTSYPLPQLSHLVRAAVDRELASYHAYGRILLKGRTGCFLGR